MRTRCLIGALLTLVGATCLGASAAPAEGRGRGLEVGFLESVVFHSPNPSVREEWRQRAIDSGAELLHVLANWRAIEGEPPDDPGDPSDPAYSWDLLDRAVRETSAAGLRPVLTIRIAPPWAEGPNRDPDAPVGSWLPDPDKLADFSRAVARRYTGDFPDPAMPLTDLPRVDLWQIWEEPNINRITPQWERAKGKWRPASALHFRKMVTEAYEAVKAVLPNSTIAAGATSPFGHPPGGERMSPLKFWQKFLCLKGKRLRKGKCPGGKVKADAIGSNPLADYAEVGPWKQADRRQDTLVRDMDELRKLLRAAKKRRTIKPRRGTEVWAGEFFWETDPPDPTGFSLSQQADFLADSLYLLWKQRVSKVLWVNLRDQPNDPDITRTLQSGLFFFDGSAKPSFEAMRFPFAANAKRAKGGGKPRIEVWGRSPVSGTVRIQRLGGGEAKTVKTLKPNAAGIFHGKLRGSKNKELRAMVGDETSFARKPH